MLTAGGVLPHRDEGLARAEQWLDDLLASIDTPAQRRLVQSYATWHVMRRLRRSAEASTRPRTYTAHARNNIRAAASFLTWLTQRGQSLPDCRPADIDDWLATGPGACQIRDFLTWAAKHKHCQIFQIPSPRRAAGTATSDDERWAIIARLFRDDSLDPTDRVAGCLLLLFGQQQSKISAMTTDQVIDHRNAVFIRFGRHNVPVPAPLGALLRQLVRDGRSHVGIGSPASTRWLFPGGLPGRPITPARLAERLRSLGIPTQPGRRAALTGLAAQLPAAVLADLLNLHPTTAAHWMHQAGGDWSRYAAELAQGPSSPTLTNTSRRHAPGRPIQQGS
jgi:hypothetical protein